MANIFRGVPVMKFLNFSSSIYLLEVIERYLVWHVSGEFSTWSSVINCRGKKAQVHVAFSN